MRREDLASLLPRKCNVRFGGRSWHALELGTATGAFAMAFAEKAIAHGFPYGRLWTVDRYACDGQGSDRHGLLEYEETATKLIEWNIYEGQGRAFNDARIIPLRMTFDEAGMVFVAHGQIFDFIFVDGYAHEGSGGADVFAKWWAFVRPGGIMAVHDACDSWPLQRDAAREFEKRLRWEWSRVGIEIEHGITDETLPEYPSWWARKPEAAVPVPHD